ncbi:hypothetical protein BC943DRAFT_48793 [Umbelopsis sp. AD052]|nr:hypothetical protein BC943DRAFT_48793 [Umbelopsis sp. AD052]
MPKEVHNSKATAVAQESKPYPTSTRRRAKKLRAETTKTHGAGAAKATKAEETEEAEEVEEVEVEEATVEEDVSVENNTKPIQKKKGAGKKTKVFATQSSMLSLIDLVAAKEDQKSQGKLKRRAEIEDKAEQRELAVLDAQAKKQNKLELVKEQIKNKRRIQQREKKRTLKQKSSTAQDKASSKKKKVGFAL